MSAIILLVLRFASAVTLYIFLGWALYTMWQDIKSQSAELAFRQPPILTLLEKINEHTKKHTFRLIEIIIGRDPACDCSLDEPTVSAKHARLYFRQGQWWVEDLHSTNGTFLNNQPVLSPTVLASNDHLSCGQVNFILKIGSNH